jgi:hypothetical protein
MGAARGKNLAAALGSHAGTETMTALPDELAGLICSLHGTAPVLVTAGRPSCEGRMLRGNGV